MTRIWDVTQVVAPGVWVWPGDRAYDCGWTWRMRDGASCNVGQIAMSCHTGTHIDAPYHFAETGATVEKAPLLACLGPCRVLPLERVAEAAGEERVLVRAGGAAPTVAQIGGLPGLRLFGIDGPSVDPMDSRTLDAHHALWHKGAVILEGLDLTAVPDGRYDLIALPLRLAGMDAAPVRALLREL
ncbi:MAG: cyclase family protein [Gemmatimonadota bacterium]